MAKRRAPKGTFYKAADWDKFVKVKKGEEKYEIERPSLPENKQLFSCGIIPFGQSVSTEADAKIHKLTSISATFNLLKAMHLESVWHHRLK